MRLISFVVPVFNEEENIETLYVELKKLTDSLQPEYDYEVIFTDNHSVDRTPELLERLAQSDKKVKVIRFSKNFGYQKSILTGYLHARGDVAIQIDCDLQDPLDMIPAFLEKWKQGYQVVYGIRKSRKENWLINQIRKLFYYIIDKLSEETIPRDAGDFRLVDRQILDQLWQLHDEQPYLRGAIASMGFNQIGLPYDRNERLKGSSKFSFSQLMKLAFDGILNHSLVPLRFATYVGLSVSVITFLGLVCYLIGKILGADWPAGFATLTILILLSLSLNALFLGIIGEYLGRIYQQVKRKPLTIIEKQFNVEKEQIR
ncbi:glycosyltransferase family 2 protein [Paenibacillus athensensis]|uniref:Glycosyltransferase n=1 Tax=Paenibacillus athensensis TaxID=1967502 RepID=A0A4Y8Q6M5_9BACL|nr:glycosyltransferase family 2 protein [Paenibacillus athensensis]MCD1259518.1 glycosyltransferase family 2 protein [Paenibacillus athensensis]